MTTVRIVDFQVYFAAAGLSAPEQMFCNRAAFPVYEAARLWLRERRVEAPFRKLLVTVKADPYDVQWHGAVQTANGVCEVTLCVPQAEVSARCNPSWVAVAALEGLERVRVETGWTNGELSALLARVGSARPPCNHRFEKLTKRFRGTTCDLVLEADGESATLKAVFVTGLGKRVESHVAHSSGPMFIEDVFPVATSAAVQGRFNLYGKGKEILASLAIPVSETAGECPGPTALPPKK